MGLATLLEIPLASSSILLWVYVGIRLLLSFLFIIAIIKLNDRSIQKTLKHARAHWSPQYSSPMSQGESYWPMPKVQRRGRQSIYIATGMILCYLIGIGSRELMLLAATSHLDHADVTQKVSDREFYFRTPQNPRIHGVFCGKMPFKEGMKVSIKFESRLYCWSVRESGLNYFIEGEANGYPDTYTNPHAYTQPVTYAAR